MSQHGNQWHNAYLLFENLHKNHRDIFEHKYWLYYLRKFHEDHGHLDIYKHINESNNQRINALEPYLFLL